VHQDDEKFCKFWFEKFFSSEIFYSKIDEPTKKILTSSFRSAHFICHASHEPTCFEVKFSTFQVGGFLGFF